MEIHTFFTVKQVAEQLHVSNGLIYKLAASGELEHHRIGAALRFSENQLQAYLDRSRENSRPLVRVSKLRHL
jgi:excisionase family DNA binding protein